MCVRARVCVCVCLCELLTFCDCMDCSISGSSIHGIHHARILEWVAIPFSREGDGYAIIKYYCSFKWNQVKKYKEKAVISIRKNDSPASTCY